jgi:hypothetical protein
MLGPGGELVIGKTFSNRLFDGRVKADFSKKSGADLENRALVRILQVVAGSSIPSPINSDKTCSTVIL